MSSKSRRKRGRQSFHGKKKKGKPMPLLTTMEPTATDKTGTRAAPLTVNTPPVTKPVPAPAPTASSYPHLTGELKKIGIIAAVMIAVLAILSRVLS
jgi:hypothetical protein